MPLTHEPNGRGLRTAAVFCLAAIFAVLAMGVTLLGSSTYRSTVRESDLNSARRTALSYVANQVRRGDAGGVEIGTFGGVDALQLTERGDDGTEYVTLIYCYDGQLRELYMERGTGLGPADGIGLLELEKLEFTVDGALLSVSAGDAGAVVLAPRTGVQEVGEL